MLAVLSFLVSLPLSLSLCSPLLPDHPCSPALPPQSVHIEDPSSLSQTLNDYLVWDIVSPACRLALIPFHCALTFPSCDGGIDRPVCQSYCQQVAANCNDQDASVLSIVFGTENAISWFNFTCPQLPTNSCYEPPSSFVPILPEPPRCEELQPNTSCSRWVDYPVYLRMNQSLLNDYVSRGSGLMSLGSSECQAAAVALYCGSIYPRCVNLTISSGVPLPPTAVIPALPCQSMCEDYLDKCSPLNDLPELNVLRFNCSSSSCNWLTKLNTFLKNTTALPCPVVVDSRFPDFPVNTSNYGLLGPTPVEASCSIIQGTATTACDVYPSVFPDDPKFVGRLRKLINGSQCELACPALYLYNESDWNLTIGWFALCIPSFILLSLLLATWVIFKIKRKQQYLICFLFSSWMIAMSLAFGFVATKGGDPRYLGCKDNSKPYYFTPSYCSAQAIVLFYFALAQNCWWLVIAFDMFRNSVLEQRPTLQEVKKRQVVYHCCSWGFPLLMLIVMLAGGAKFGSEQINFTLFCWIYERPPVLEYVTWIVPLCVIWLTGGGMIFAVLRKVRHVQDAVAVRDSGWRVKTQIRLIVFIMLFLVFNLWFVLFAILYATQYDDIITEGGYWLLGFVSLSGMPLEIRKSWGLSPWKRFDPVLLNGLHFAWSSQGIFFALVWGPSKENFELWRNFFTGKSTVSRTEKPTKTKLAAPRGERKFTTSASNDNFSIPKRGTQEERQERASSESVYHLSEKGGPSSMVTTEDSPFLPSLVGPDLHDSQTARTDSAPTETDPPPSEAPVEGPPDLVVSS